MPRNTSGVYSYPANTAPVAGERASADKQNQRWDDIAADLNGPVLDKVTKGTVPFTAPVRGVDGSAAAPAHSFDGDRDTGMFRAAADQIGFSTGGTMRALLSSSGYTVNVPITGTAVTQSATDTTSGRLLKVGDGGINVAISLTSTDNLNDLRGSGLFYNPTSTNTPGNNYPEASSGSLLQIDRSNINRTQLFTSYGTAATYVRSHNGTAWSAWERVLTGSDKTTSATDTTLGRLLKVGAGYQQLDATLYRRGNILGAVSQSGGIPTGAVIERGSNSNGEFVRFADGTQICKSQQLNGNVSADTIWNFPAQFAAVPDVVPGNTAFEDRVITRGATSTSTSAASLRIHALGGARSTTAFSVVAIGRWY